MLILKALGVGKFSPNIVMMGYKNDWQSCNSSELNEYYNNIQ